MAVGAPGMAGAPTAVGEVAAPDVGDAERVDAAGVGVTWLAALAAAMAVFSAFVSAVGVNAAGVVGGGRAAAAGVQAEKRKRARRAKAIRTSPPGPLSIIATTMR